MKQLSIFVDESGDFGSYSSHAPYYIVSMIFHDQTNNINPQIAQLNNSILSLVMIKTSLFTLHL
ncbi:MAG: hypothetical protein IKP67_10275 [Spirochaetales bacterium]|nr:hypothetical protein [Spirochaetales bacterium]